MLPKYFLTLSCLLLTLLIWNAQSAKIDATAAKINEPRVTKTDKNLPKRSLNSFLGDAGFANGATYLSGPWNGNAGRFGNGFGNGFGGNSGLSSWNPWNGYSSKIYGSPSPTEVANAIAAAKQASANVLIAQQQMQAAKDNVLNQQRLAMEKETAATLLTQKSEAAAAIQRSEAAAAAQAVVLAQQRLAASKSAVAHQQRIAAAREAEAAAALQRSAHAAAAEIQKTEYEAAKFGQFTRNGNAGAAHHLTLTKDTAFSPITAGTNHVPGLESLGPWSSSSGLLASGVMAKPAANGPWF